MIKHFKRYLPFLREYKLQYFIVAIGVILVVGATTATAHIMKPLMDDMFIAKDEKMLYIIPIALVSIYFIKSVGRYLQSVFVSYIGQHMVATLKEVALDKIIKLDMTFLYVNRSGELISRITNDIDRVRYFVSTMLPELIRESLTAVALVGYVIYLNHTLAFYSLVVLPLIIYPIMKASKKLKKYSHKSQRKNADVLNSLSEVFNNAEMIKAASSEDYEIKRFKTQNREFLKINMKSVYVGDLVAPILEMMGAIGLAMVIYIGGKEVYNGAMSVGEFSAFITAVGLVFQPLRRVGAIYPKIQDAIAASERMFELFDTKSIIDDGEDRLKNEIKSIEFKKVDLYFEDTKILQNINLKLHKGEKIALVGDSGGGKSSLVNMLLRFYDASSGELLINNQNIKTFTQASLRDEISYVSQRVYIFADTLAANVAYAQEIDEARVIEALKLADAWGFVSELEDGIYTVMEEFGVNLSGGQRQRIAIARAIYKHSSLIIFDEATSALDNESEKRIQTALDEYTKDKITITIAHRLSTIKNATKIIVIQKGSIVDSGTHDELLQKSEIYKKLSGGLE